MHIDLDIPVIFYNSLVNKTTDFYQTDTKEFYEINKKKLGKNWYYFENPIEYKFNEWGYRTKNFNDLDDDYILTFGCSYTEGIGLHEKDTWSYKLSRKLDKDLLNLAKGSSSLSSLLYNNILFFNFITKNKKIPSHVFIQYPFLNRKHYGYNKKNNFLEFLFISDNENNQKNKILKNFHDEFYLNNGGERDLDSIFIPLIINNLWNSINVNVYHWTYLEDYFQTKFHNLQDFEILKIIDPTSNDIFKLARDVDENGSAHNGRFAQDIVVDELLKNIENG